MSKEIIKLTEEALKSGDYKNPIPQIKAAIKKDSYNEDLLYSLGILYDHLAQTKKILYRKLLLHNKAKNLYKKILKTNPNSKKGLIGLGRVYWHKNKANKSLHYYQKALTIYPNDAEILNALANVYKMQKEYNTAAKYYQKAIDTSQTSYGTYFNFAKLLIIMNQKEKAQKIFILGKELAKQNILLPMENNIITELENQIKNL